jgi:hypothetical protein
MSFYINANKNEGIDWIAKIGDKVELRDGRKGKVVSLSIGWKPEMYVIQFPNKRREWVSRDQIIPVRERVVFT